MLIYEEVLYLFIFTFVTGDLFENIPFDDNPIKNRFGVNNLCIYFDFRPFSSFASTLIFPGIILFLLYEIFDAFRVYDNYTDGHNISRRFWIIYFTLTCAESFCMVLFMQNFATSPYEDIYVHTWPYFLTLYALWSVSFKRFVYLYKIGTFKKYHGSAHYLGVLYVFTSLVTVIIKLMLGIPNLYEARLFDTYPWTNLLADINGNFYLFLTLVLPICVYFVVTEELKCVKLTINRQCPKSLD